jgi:hypothetical protein
MVSELYTYQLKCVREGLGTFVGILEDQWKWLERIISFNVQQNRVMCWIADLKKKGQWDCWNW